jgi:hypothetical protein
LTRLNKRNTLRHTRVCATHENAVSPGSINNLVEMKKWTWKKNKKKKMTKREIKEEEEKNENNKKRDASV